MGIASKEALMAHHAPFTFGGGLRMLRTRAGLSQSDMAEALGYKTIDRYWSYEDNSERMTRERLELVAGGLLVNREEMGYLLYLGKYEPTEEDVRFQQAETAPLLDSTDIPQYLSTYDQRIVDVNDGAAELFGLKRNEVRKERPSLISLIIKEELAQFDGFEEMMRSHIAMFRYETSGLTTEQWFMKYQAGLAFRNRILSRLLHEVSQGEATLTARSSDFTNFRWMRFPVVANKKVRELRTFGKFTEPLIADQRFQFTMLLPNPAVKKADKAA